MHSVSLLSIFFQKSGTKDSVLMKACLCYAYAGPYSTLMNFGEYPIYVSSELVKPPVKGVTGKSAQGYQRLIHRGGISTVVAQADPSLPVDGELCKHISRRRPVRCQNAWSLKCDFTHSLDQQSEKSATVIKRVWVWVWTPPYFHNLDGLPPASQIPVCNFGCSVTVVSKYDCQPVLGNSGDRYSCKNDNPARTFVLPTMETAALAAHPAQHPQRKACVLSLISVI